MEKRRLRFTKMHGLGNDFMVVDGISQRFVPEEAPLAAWAERHTGVGFDQLLLVEKSGRADVDFRYRIFNADGSEVEQCGNGARCFARFVADSGLSDKSEIVVETTKGIIRPRLNADGTVRVNMGQPRFAAAEVPFALEAGEDDEALRYAVAAAGIRAEVAMVGMGNPHAVMLVDDVAAAPVAEWGAALQSHPRFPQRVNAGFMQIVDPRHIRLRVFERGVGETQACGTGACAAVAAGVRLGLLAAGEDVAVELPGGTLSINWQSGQDLMMSGPAVEVFAGELVY